MEICPRCYKETQKGIYCQNCGHRLIQQVVKEKKANMKKCPYCAEDIQNEAIVCPYCQRELVKPKGNPWLWVTAISIGLCLACLAGVGILMNQEYNMTNFIAHFITNAIIWTLIAALVLGIIAKVIKAIRGK